MDYEEFAADLPSNGTMVFSSAEENEDTMKRLGVHQEMRQTGQGSFRTDLAVRETRAGIFYSDRFSTESTMSLASPDGMVAIMMLRHHEREFVVCGKTVAEDQLLFWPERSEAQLRVPGLGGSDSVAMPADRFREAAEVVSPDITWPETLAVVDGKKSELLEMRSSIVAQVNRSEPGPQGEEAANLATHLIAWTADQLRRGRNRALVTDIARSGIARRAQEYIEAGFREALHLEELCRATGVGLRTLQRCFREYCDLTITQYLLSVRLHAAHRELSVARPQEDSVTDIALRSGFTHLGRFSVAFRERFGESPRDTLARPARPSVSLAA